MFPLNLYLTYANELAGDGMEEDEEPPVVGGPVADSTFAECVARRQKPPQFVPPVTEMAESTDHGTCMLCFQPDFHPGPDFSERTMIVCDSCEREYHVGCLRECGLSVLDQLPAGEWFCCQTCFKILKEVRGMSHPHYKIFKCHLIKYK